MSKPLNFLIGRGEVLTSATVGTGHPHNEELEPWDSSKLRLLPMINQIVSHINSLSTDASPSNRAVVNLNMHPKKIARSYFPAIFLREFSFESVGSRTIPAKVKTKDNESETTTTTQYIIAGKKADFEALATKVTQLREDDKITFDLRRFESIEPRLATDSIVKTNELFDSTHFEVVLHLLPSDEFMVKEKFLHYAEKSGVKVFYDLGITVGNLWFIPVEGSFSNVEKLSEFVFVRVIRNLPQLRSYPDFNGFRDINLTHLPHSISPLNTSSEIRVGILDGGIPQDHFIMNLVNDYKEMNPDSADHSRALRHGLSTTSAYLFGSIANGNELPQPYTYVDHIRVMDQETAYDDDPLNLYKTLNKIYNFFITEGPQYQFLNLSMGPNIPIEDTEVHSWTAVIDDFLKDGRTFMTIATGNNGNNEIIAGNERRVLVPSDAVNAITVGSANKPTQDWKRAEYSAIGPGRLTGIIKPDLVCFGGSSESPFFTLNHDQSFILSPKQGTSYAAPCLLRTAAGIKTILGPKITPLGIKALLIHTADRNGHSKEEVGWGKIPENIAQIVTCESYQARIIYQGTLNPSRYIEAKIPVPNIPLDGRIKLTATFCYACPVDPQDAAAYTQAALEVTFRPNDMKFKKPSSKRPSSGSFFKKSVYAHEKEQREHDGKWETVLHATRPMLGKGLNNPCFDIHYIARERGGSTTSAPKIPYALVITLEAPKRLNLYNEIVQAYSNILLPFEPQIDLPLSAT